ncbi:hypothetical protein [Mycobacterium sp. NPDC050441]|uniref:hypothetical protein n=1 Tax=Mycobacterium sp. NPDC050441 TaxID=3155403 RepID=UPI0033C3ED2B
MTSRCRRLLFAMQVGLVAVFVAMAAAGCAPAEPSTSEAAQLHDVDQNSPEGEAILNAAATDVDGQLGKPAQFSVQTFKAANGWAFLSAQLKNSDGNPFDYAGTPLAEAAANGGASKRYVGLFRSNQSGGWDLVTSAVGPTAPVWTEWAQEYSAPAELFGN